MRDVANQIQRLTPEQQSRCYFAVVATGFTQADQTRQNNQHAMVRLRNGVMKPIRELPKISKDDPQPNGDYSITLINNHSDDVANQSGAGWLFLSDDGTLHMMYCLSTNQAANSIQPLAADGMLQFSTEGLMNDLGKDGLYGDFWINAVAPCKVGNDPGTQSVENKLGGNMPKPEEEVQNAEMSEALKKELADIVKNAVVKNDDSGDLTSKLLKFFNDNGINDADLISRILGAAASSNAGAGAEDAPDKVPDDTSSPTGAANTVERKNSMQHGNAGQFMSSTVDQPMKNTATVVQNTMEKLSQSPQYLEAWATDLRNGWNPEKANFGENVSALYTKNDITITPESGVAIPPEMVLTKIAALIESDNNIIGHLNFTNVKQYDVSGFKVKSQQAHGRTKGSVAQKKGTDITIQPRTITSASLYKFARINSDYIEDTGGMTNSAFVDELLNDLPTSVILAIEQGVLVGGITNDNEGIATPFTKLQPIQADVEADHSVWGGVKTMSAGQTLLSALSQAMPMVRRVRTVDSQNNRFLLISEEEYRGMLDEAVVGNSTVPPVFTNTMDAIASYLGLDGVLVIPWLAEDKYMITETNPNVQKYMSKYRAAIVNLGAYKAIGDLSPQVLSEFHMSTNSQDFEAKSRIGGALTLPYSAALIAKAPAASGLGK